MRRCLVLLGVLVATLACTGGTGAPEPAPPAAPDPDPPARDRRARRDRALPDARPPAADPAPAPDAPDARLGGGGGGGGGKAPPTTEPAGVTQTGERRWRVSRRLAERWQEDPSRLAEARRKGAGWELVGVRRGDAWHLGMRNGDVLLEVNGHRLETDSERLAAWLALRDERSFEVVFLRDGERRVHHYEIAD